MEAGCQSKESLLGTTKCTIPLKTIRKTAGQNKPTNLNLCNPAGALIFQHWSLYYNDLSLNTGHSAGRGEKWDLSLPTASLALFLCLPSWWEKWDVGTTAALGKSCWFCTAWDEREMRFSAKDASATSSRCSCSRRLEVSKKSSALGPWSFTTYCSSSTSDGLYRWNAPTKPDKNILANNILLCCRMDFTTLCLETSSTAHCLLQDGELLTEGVCKASVGREEPQLSGRAPVYNEKVQALASPGRAEKRFLSKTLPLPVCAGNINLNGLMFWPMIRWIPIFYCWLKQKDTLWVRGEKDRLMSLCISILNNDSTSHNGVESSQPKGSS